MAQSNSNFDNLDAATSSSPISDPDPFAGNSTRNPFNPALAHSLPPHIDISSLPGAVPILGYLTGSTPAYRTRMINARLIQMSSTIKRPLTATEEQAVAWHTARGFSIISWGPPIGIAAGMVRWWRTMSEMRWLGVGKLSDESVNQAWKAYREGEGKRPAWDIRWDGGKLWVGDRELMKACDPAKRLAVVQGFRAIPYISLGWLLTSIVSRLYAGTVVAIGEMQDSRLENMEQDLKTHLQKTMREKQVEAPAAMGGAGKDRNEPTNARANKSPSETSQTRRGPLQRGYGSSEGEDDASPTNSEIFFEEPGVEDQSRMTETHNTNSQRQRGFRRVSQNDPFEISERQGGFQQERYEKQAPRMEDSFDDASPIGGAGATGNDDVGSSGSVWERIRQDSASRSTQSAGGVGENRQRRSGEARRQSQNPRQRNSEDENFMFSSSKEEKSYAKSEAQQEFDARVEKESEGGDFDSRRKW